ncbi:MAG: class I SAM-dependent methyltransferase [Deltaproteobacteria bacterium]|nr:class I SAM-dependent methyltransferase [Deltaproteobacteria bacterium]
MAHQEERDRILQEYERRAREIDPTLYAPWNPAEEFMRAGRRRWALRLLRRQHCFPEPSDSILEIGYGNLGWLGEMLAWGILPENLHGIELDPKRAAQARRTLPTSDLQIGDARQLPWPSNSFALAIASTVWTSVLDSETRQAMASEVVRVLRPGGALLWYDFRVNNPRNPNVRGIGRQEIRELFHPLQGPIRSLTLAPPLARRLLPGAHWLATTLETIPLLRSHLLAVLRKPSSGVVDGRTPSENQEL